MVTAAETLAILARGSYTAESGGSPVPLRPWDRVRRAASAVRLHRNAHELADAALSQRVDSGAQTSIFRGGAFEAVRWLQLQEASRGQRICVLDFASDSNPGGGWRSAQQGTQEESLARSSNLGLCLEGFYERVGAADYMPRLSVVFAPDVVAFHTGRAFLEEPVWLSVVAAALRGGDDEDVFLAQKVRGVLAVAAHHRQQVLVLGAWGCGAFGNSPVKVARAFRRHLEAARGVFPHVVFALPGSGENPEAFIAEFSEAAVVEPRPDPAVSPRGRGLAQRGQRRDAEEVEALEYEVLAAVDDSLLQAILDASPGSLQQLREKAAGAPQALAHRVKAALVARFAGAGAQQEAQTLRRVLPPLDPGVGPAPLSTEEESLQQAYRAALGALVKARLRAAR